MTLRVGILGCGRIAGYFHGPVLGGMDGVAITALADPVAENRRRLARWAPGAVHYADWRLPIALREIDAAVICLPPALHAPASIAAFEAGCHVYVEKPLALSESDGRAMISAWEAAGTVGMVGLNFRFHPLVVDAHARVANGEIGRVVAVRTLFTSARREMPGWKMVEGAGGDALADLGTHDFDLASHIAGSRVLPESLHTEQASGPHGSFAVLVGRLENAAFLSMSVGQTTGHGTRRLEILGETGHLTLELSDARPRAVERPPGRFARASRLWQRMALLSPAEILHPAGREPSFAAALSAFVAAASSGRAATPDLSDGLRALELVLAATTRGSAAPETGVAA